VEILRATNGRHADPEKNSNLQPKEKAKYRKPEVQVDGPAYVSRERAETEFIDFITEKELSKNRQNYMK
jgi:hypothetical protein